MLLNYWKVLKLTSGAVGLSLLASGSHLELHLTHVQDGASALVQRFLLFLGEAEDTEGLLYLRSITMVLLAMLSDVVTVTLGCMANIKQESE